MSLKFPEIAGVVPTRKDTHVTTGIARASFASVIKPKPNMSRPDQLEYQIVLIFKHDSPTIPVLQEALKDAVEKKWGAKPPKGLRNPIRDCADKDYEGFEAGDYYITCRSSDKPGVIDAAMNPITEPSGLTSGCFVRANISAFGYDKAGNKGVAFGLSHVQKLANGPSLTGRQPADKVFDVVVIDGDPFGEDAEEAATGAPKQPSLFD